MLSIKKHLSGEKIITFMLLLIIAFSIGAIFKYFRPALFPSSPSTVPVNESPLEGEAIKIVTKVIDGDTVIVESGDSVRLLGMDTDESGYPCYEEAKKRLEELVLGKEVKLEKGAEDKDQYGRLLRYLIIGSSNINLELVEEGLAICRFIEPNIKYKDQCAQIEKTAKENKTGCKWQVANCNCAEWTNNNCGGGSCQNTQMFQSRSCNPAKCSSETRCLTTSACSEVSVPVAPNCNWENLTSEKTGLGVVDAEDAKNYYSENKIIEGKVAGTKRYDNPALFINFCKPNPNHCFTAIVWNDHWKNFPQDAADLYYNKTVRVRGYIEPYNGKPEIAIDDPSQIEICK